MMLTWDCLHPGQRGEATVSDSPAPLHGPAVGSSAGGFIAETDIWQSVFWSPRNAPALVQISGIFFL